VWFRAGVMKNRKKAVVIVAVLVAILGAVILAVGIWRQPEKTLLKVMSDKVDLQVRNVHYTEVGDSGMKWEIDADTARYQKKENLALFDKVTVKLVTKDGRTYVMNGDRGRFNTESRDMQIEGNVVIVSEAGDRFTTDRLQYRHAEKRIDTDGPVVMENRRVRISGVGMTLALDGKKVSLLSKVRANTVGGMKGVQ
jgi:LPS export ABC transporter protein LptC